MDCLIPTLKGLETICAADIFELIKKKAIIGKQFCLVKNITSQDIAKLAYVLQSGISILPLLTKGKHIDKLTLMDKELFKNSLQEGMKFAVRSIKTKNEKLSSEELHEEIGACVSKWLKENNISPQVSLTKPDITFLVVANDEEYFVGIDVIGFRLCKRPYKLFQHPASLNGCIAYGIAKCAGLTKESVVLDPFCGTGTIPIEVALYQQEMSPFHFENKFAGLSISFFKKEFEKQANLEKNKKVQKRKIFGFDSQLKMMNGAKQNAKIAGIKDGVSFSKVSIDWVDAKFQEGEVNIIITQPPIISERTHNEKDVRKLFDELCYQSKYLLNKKGTLGVFVNRPEVFKEAAIKHKLTFKSEQAFQLGDATFVLLIFSP
ncbi:RNA methyltransferase [Candidatus Woesearchaeota archaeon]|nr:RNA methyltransferase [Candidatus Woesearchaeota archaeon]